MRKKKKWKISALHYCPSYDFVNASSYSLTAIWSYTQFMLCHVVYDAASNRCGRTRWKRAHVRGWIEFGILETRICTLHIYIYNTLCIFAVVVSSSLLNLYIKYKKKCSFVIKQFSAKWIKKKHFHLQWHFSFTIYMFCMHFLFSIFCIFDRLLWTNKFKLRCEKNRNTCLNSKAILCRKYQRSLFFSK